jgi:hypothetical protein
MFSLACLVLLLHFYFYTEDRFGFEDTFLRWNSVSCVVVIEVKSALARLVVMTFPSCHQLITLIPFFLGRRVYLIYSYSIFI